MKRDGFFSFIPQLSSLVPALRGRVTLRAAALEAVRRARLVLSHRSELQMLTRARGADSPARLAPEFERRGAAGLLAHFRTRGRPRFLPGFEEADDAETFRRALREKFAADRAALVAEAEEIAGARRWPLLGSGALAFPESPDWTRDPLSGASWPLEYHADLRLARSDGGDVRVVWELNRLGHLLTLGRAYAA